MSKSKDCYLALTSLAIIFASATSYAQTIGYYTLADAYAAQSTTEEPVPACGLFADAEWISWQIDGSNQTYATTKDPVWLTERENSDANQKGNGIRGKIGFRTESAWDLAVGYTYFTGDDGGTIDTSLDPSSVLTASRSRLDLEAQDVVFDDSTKLNMFDFEVGRRMQISNFNFRPFGGFRWVELDQEQLSGYSYNDLTGTPNINSIAATSDLKAYGLRMGAEANVALVGGLRAFGRGAGSVLVGDLKSKAYEVDAQQGVVLNRNFNETVAVPELEVAAGLAWNMNGFEIKGGYELNTLFNASNIGGDRSDVLMHGFFAGASWNY